VLARLDGHLRCGRWRRPSCGRRSASASGSGARADDLDAERLRHDPLASELHPLEERGQRDDGRQEDRDRDRPPFTTQSSTGPPVPRGLVIPGRSTVTPGVLARFPSAPTRLYRNLKRRRDRTRRTFRRPAAPPPRSLDSQDKRDGLLTGERLRPGTRLLPDRHGHRWSWVCARKIRAGRSAQLLTNTSARWVPSRCSPTGRDRGRPPRDDSGPDAEIAKSPSSAKLAARRLHREAVHPPQAAARRPHQEGTSGSKAVEVRLDEAVLDLPLVPDRRSIIAPSKPDRTIRIDLQARVVNRVHRPKAPVSAHRAGADHRRDRCTSGVRRRGRAARSSPRADEPRRPGERGLRSTAIDFIEPRRENPAKTDDATADSSRTCSTCPPREKVIRMRYGIGRPHYSLEIGARFTHRGRIRQIGSRRCRAAAREARKGLGVPRSGHSRPASMNRRRARQRLTRRRADGGAPSRRP
jgi:hypothetical protein